MQSHLTPSPEALLLDAGNTVVLVDHALVASLLDGCGIGIEASALLAALGAANQAYAAALAAGASHEEGWLVYLGRWLEAAGLGADEVARAVPAVRAHHATQNLWRCVPDGLVAALAALRRAGLTLGVVSNSEGKLAALLAEVGLGQSFDVVVDSGCEGVCKPDPEIFWRACRRAGVSPARSLYAGDIPEVDVRGARAAGLRAVLVDPYGIYPGYADAPRVGSVLDLCQALLAGAAAAPDPRA